MAIVNEAFIRTIAAECTKQRYTGSCTMNSENCSVCKYNGMLFTTSQEWAAALVEAEIDYRRNVEYVLSRRQQAEERKQIAEKEKEEIRKQKEEIEARKQKEKKVADAKERSNTIGVLYAGIIFLGIICSLIAGGVFLLFKVGETFLTISIIATVVICIIYYVHNKSIWEDV